MRFPGSGDIEGVSLLEAAAESIEAAPSSPGVRHVHNVSLMLERAVVFGSDRLFLWPIRVPPGTAALTVEGSIMHMGDSFATPVLLMRTGGRVPSTENFDAAEAFLTPIEATHQEKMAEAGAAAATARRLALLSTRNATTAETAAEAAAAAVLDQGLLGDADAGKPRAAVRVILKGHQDTVFAGIWGGRPLYGNTYPQASHTRDISVRLAARAEVCSPPTAPVDGRCVRVGSGVFLLPGVSGKHEVKDLSGGLAWTFTLVGAVDGLETSPDRAVQTLTVPRFTSAMTITLSRWEDAATSKLHLRLYSEACVDGATSAEDGEGLDRPVTMTADCEDSGWEVAELNADKAGATRSTTILLPRSGRWVAVASLRGPTEDLDPNPVTAAVTMTTYTVARSAASGAGVLFSDAERTLAAPEGASGAHKGGSKKGVAGSKRDMTSAERTEAETRWRAAEAAAQAARQSGKAAPGWPFSLDAGTTATQGLTQDFAAPSDSAAMFKLTRAGGDVATISDLRRAASDHGSNGNSARMAETKGRSDGDTSAKSEPLSLLGAGMVGDADDLAPTDMAWSMHTMTVPDWSGSGFWTFRLLLNSSMLRPAAAKADHPGCRPLRVLLRRAGMPLAYHLDVPGHARMAAEDAGGKGAPVMAPADYTLAPENARIVKAVGAGFTELVWEVERPPPGEWFAAVVHSAAGSDLVCKDVLSTADQAEVDAVVAQRDGIVEMGDGTVLVKQEDEDFAKPAAAGSQDTSASASAGPPTRGGSGAPGEAVITAAPLGSDSSPSSSSSSTEAAAPLDTTHDGGKPALRATPQQHATMKAQSVAALLQTGVVTAANAGRVSALRHYARVAALRNAIRAAASAPESTLNTDVLAVRSMADLRGAVRLHHASPMIGGVPSLVSAPRDSALGANADPSPIMPQTHPIVGTGALSAGSASRGGSTGTETIASVSSNGILAIENSLSEELGEVMNMAKQYLSELGFGTGVSEEEARRRAAQDYNPADKLYAISASLTACSAHCSGQCTLLRSEGFVAGQCVCTNPYRFAGDYCDEESGSVAFYTLSTFMLVASNAAMLPAILLSLRWRLWGEAVVLTGAALSSALYHTCDQFLFCFSSTYHSLQAMDISGAYLAVTVTLMLLAGIPQIGRLSASIALLAFFLFTLDNPASLGRAAGLGITVVTAVASIFVGAAYSVLRNFAAWSKLASREAQTSSSSRRAGGDDFDGDAVAQAFLGDEEPDSGAGGAFEDPHSTGTAAPAARGRAVPGKTRRGGQCSRFVRSPFCCCGMLSCCVCDCCDPANWSCQVFAAARFMAWFEDAKRGWVAPSLARRSPRVAHAAGLGVASMLAQDDGTASLGASFDDGFAERTAAALPDASAEAMAAAMETPAALRARARPDAAPPAESATSESGEDEEQRAHDGDEEQRAHDGDEEQRAHDGDEDDEAESGHRAHADEGDTEADAIVSGPSTGGGDGVFAGGLSTAGSAGGTGGMRAPTHSPIRQAQAAPAWCTTRAQTAIADSAGLLLVGAGNFRWRYITAAMVLFGVAMVLVLLTNNENYWLMHSVWHGAIMLVPAALIMARVDPRGPLLVFNAKARRSEATLH
jgi:hypothetical protein